ncbi:hypothetical protein SBA3_2920010 [Candidatus Sulfopaludibacter sp. SbA3]|nr:hypothetical protein SBA3_2920010 [Candidatus Sulfopaludibacter sp. SbA3]
MAWTRERGSSSNPTGVSLGADGYGEWLGRTDGSWIWAKGSTLSFGGMAQRQRDDGNAYEYYLNPYVLLKLDQYRGTATRHGAYVQQNWSAAKGRVTFTAGTRYDHTNVTGGYLVSPFASFTVQPLTATRVQLGWGKYGQFPDLSQSYSIFGSRWLLPERATHYEAAIEQNLDDKTRLRLEYYDRQDRDLLWRPLFDPRLLPNGKVFTAPNSAPTVNSQRGYSRGFQVFLRRRTANGFTGWISYAYGVAKVTDGVLHLTFLPASQRIDFRINKAFVHDKWKMTLYGEVVNLLNHDNRRFDAFDGYTSSGQAFPTFFDMFPILPSVGLVFER